MDEVRSGQRLERGPGPQAIDVIGPAHQHLGFYRCDPLP